MFKIKEAPSPPFKRLARLDWSEHEEFFSKKISVLLKGEDEKITFKKKNLTIVRFFLVELNKKEKINL
jgi:hypothetical protein